MNHEPIKFNGDYDHLDVKMEGEKITVTEIELKNIKPRDFVYCVAVPLAADESPYKSYFQMVIDENGTYGDGNAQPAKPESTQASSSSLSEEKTVNTTERLTPAFAIGDSLYVKKFENAELLKLNSDGEIEKSLVEAYMAAVHGDKIAVATPNRARTMENGIVIMKKDPSTTLTLYDKDLNVIKTLEIKGRDTVLITRKYYTKRTPKTARSSGFAAGL